jgi:hypothetical protein
VSVRYAYREDLYIHAVYKEKIDAGTTLVRWCKFVMAVAIPELHALDPKSPSATNVVGMQLRLELSVRNTQIAWWHLAMLYYTPRYALH